jgi:hypothetical protein
MDNNSLQEAIYKGADLTEYQDHIAWQGIVKPWLERERSKFQAYLVDVVLSHRPIPLDNGQLLTAERCAAYIEAIDGLERLFTVINRRRDSALAQLQDVDMFSIKDIDNRE